MENIVYIDRKPAALDERSPLSILGRVVFVPTDCRNCSVLSDNSLLKDPPGSYLQLKLFGEAENAISEVPRELKDRTLEVVNERASSAISGQCQFIGAVGLSCWRNKTQPRGSTQYEHGRALALKANKQFDRIAIIEKEITELNLTAKNLRKDNPRVQDKYVPEKPTEIRARLLDEQADCLLSKRAIRKARFNRLVKKASKQFSYSSEYAKAIQTS